MENLQFYTAFSVEEKCIDYFKKHLSYKVQSCTNCSSDKLRWNNSFCGWKCSSCTKKISLKSICFMRDSNKSFSDWLEILHLVMNDKKPISVQGILRQSKQKRNGTVLYMIRKIQLELGKINSKTKYSKISEISFEGSRKKSINFPDRIVVCYKPSENRKRDEIRLFLNNNYRCYARNLKRNLLSTNFSFPKLLVDEGINEVNQKYYQRQKIKVNWRNKITGNLIRLLDGIHHEVAWYNLQLILDEYCFKYNRRYSIEWKVDLFMQEIAIRTGRIAHTQ